MSSRHPRFFCCGLLLTLGLALLFPCRADALPAPKLYNHALDTQLIEAVKGGAEGNVQQLLRDGADPNTKDASDSNTPVLAEVASSFSNPNIITDLVEAGADLEATNSQGATALALASIAHHGEVIKLLLKAGAKVDAPTSEGLTALMLAACGGQEENVQLLLAAGANVNARSTTNGTALIYGSAKTIAGTGKLEIIKILVDAGADVGVIAANGKDAMIMADTYGLTDIADYLREIRKRDDGLFNALAAAYNDRKNANSTAWGAVKAALATGANPRFSASYGRTGLMFLTYGIPGADDETTKAIVDHSDLNAQENQFGDTALHLAVSNGAYNLADYLIQRGASLHLVNKEKQTPLDLAIANHNQQMIELLKGAEAEEKDMAVLQEAANALGKIAH